MLDLVEPDSHWYDAVFRVIPALLKLFTWAIDRRAKHRWPTIPANDNHLALTASPTPANSGSMKAIIDINGSQVELDGTPAEIAAVIGSMGGKRRGRPLGRPKAIAAKAPTKAKGPRPRFTDAQRRDIIKGAATVKRGGLPAYLSKVGVSYGSLALWRSKFKKGK
jgi:hypothetical protein